MGLIKNLFPQTIKNYYHLAQAFLANVLNGWPGYRLKVIGVTGTDGKTTTTHLIYHVLKTAGFKVGMVSTIAAKINDRNIDTGFHVTTPDSYKLQKLLREAVTAGLEYMVIEATSHGLDQNRLWGIPFSIGVFTNLSHEHLDYHHSMAAYLKAKMKLFTHVQFAVLNADDPSFTKVRRLMHTRVISYGLDHDAQIKATDVKDTGAYQEFTAEKMKVKIRLKGRYNVANSLAAMGVAEAVGIANPKLVEALRTFPAVPGRMEEIANNRGFRVIVDFAHTPNSITNILSNLKSGTEGRVIAVFGSAGGRDKSKRPLMGKAAKEFADVTILTADDPREEQVTAIADQIADGAGFHLNKDLFIIPDRREAIVFAVNKIARKGDTIAFLGKAHERSLSVAGRELPWDEVAAVQDALKIG